MTGDDYRAEMTIALDAGAQNGAAAPDICHADTIASAPDRRRREQPSTPADVVYDLPARILMDRLPTPMLAAGLDGVLTYANLACARMLGYPDPTALIGRSLLTMMARHPDTAPGDCVTALRTAAGAITDWYAADGLTVRTVVSEPLLTRATDPILLISITDITELLWTNPQNRTDAPTLTCVALSEREQPTRLQCSQRPGNGVDAGDVVHPAHQRAVLD